MLPNPSTSSDEFGPLRPDSTRPSDAASPGPSLLWSTGFCPHCSLDFGTAGARNRHLRYQKAGWQPQFPCPVCRTSIATFTTSRELKAHFNFEHLHKPILTCERQGCDKTFWTAATRRVHYKSAHSLESFQCAICERFFLTPSGRYQHMRSIHGDLSRRLVPTTPCEMCPRKVRNPIDLILHETTCHERYQYQCYICRQPQYSRTTLVAHYKFCSHNQADKISKIRQILSDKIT